MRNHKHNVHPSYRFKSGKSRSNGAVLGAVKLVICVVTARLNVLAVVESVILYRLVLQEAVGKRVRRAVVSTASSPGMVITKVLCNNTPIKALVDSGASCTLMTRSMAQHLKLDISGCSSVISSLSGEAVIPKGQVKCDIEVQGHVICDLPVFVLSQLPCGSQLLLGMDAVRKVGGLLL